MIDLRLAAAMTALVGEIPPTKPMRNYKDWRASGPVDPIRVKGNRAGRNAPCPCGSGKKFKKCCLYEKEGVA